MEPLRRHLWAWLWPALALIILGCAAGLWITPLRLLPQHALAQARWRAQGIHHYRMTVTFSQGWILSGPWTVEVRDERVIAGYDARTGAPLSTLQLRLAQRRLPISVIFAAVEEELRTPAPTSLRALATRLARVAPALRSRLDRCATRMPNVAYDPVLGYPRGVTTYPSPCFPGDNWTVLVLELTPLP